MNHLDASNKKFKRVAFTQEMKGLDKYGEPLNPHNKNYNWLEMATEELVDGFKYLHAEQVKRNEIVAQIREIVKYNTIPMVHDQITVLLDELADTVRYYLEGRTD